MTPVNVFVVINILHEVSMSFLFCFSVAFNFTTYQIKKIYKGIYDKEIKQEDISTWTCDIRDFLPIASRYICKLYKFKTNWTHINVCLPNYWTNRFNIWDKEKGRIVYSFKYPVNPNTSYSNVFKLFNRLSLRKIISLYIF